MKRKYNKLTNNHEIKTVRHHSNKGYYSNNDSSSRKKILPKIPRAESSTLLVNSQSRNKKKFLTIQKQNQLRDLEHQEKQYALAKMKQQYSLSNRTVGILHPEPEELKDENTRLPKLKLKNPSNMELDK